MAENPADLTLEMLRQMRAEQAIFREDMAAFRSQMATDFVEIRRTLRGLTSMMATFTGRLEDVETRTRVLEQR